MRLKLYITLGSFGIVIGTGRRHGFIVKLVRGFTPWYGFMLTGSVFALVALPVGGE